MSRRKQPNPNKLRAVMENPTAESQQEGGANTQVKTEEAELKEETTTHTTHQAMNGGQPLQNGDAGGGGGGDSSSINAMMSAVMSAAGTINGGGGEEGGSGVTSANSSAGPSPSPSPNKSSTAAMRAPPNRNARRNQDKDDSSAFICPLCDKNCQTQHQLTMHIRQHNADAGATDHSCSICGKCSSSASSSDRHMSVHSGERPYKCNICGQTFTTNGNMHRHMKIHDKDPASGSIPISNPPSPTKRRRPSMKRRMGSEDEPGDEPLSKKVLEDLGADESVVVPGSEEESSPCPICFKTCNSRSDLDAHMDTHPDTMLRCDRCCLSFRTHRGSSRHNAGVHKLLPQDPSGRPFIQNNPSIPTGFNDSAFIDFSCSKFAHIAQVWCETNSRRCISKFHRFVCDSCDKAFPSRSALDLHRTTSHTDRAAPAAAEEKPKENGRKRAEGGDAGQSSFSEASGSQHISEVKSGPTDDEIHQAHSDSIKVIHVEPSSFSLPQEPASSFPSGGVGVTSGSGGSAALSVPSSEASGSASQGSSQRDAFSLSSSQPFQAGFSSQPEGGAATAGAASSSCKPGESGGSGVMESADIQQISKVATAPPNQMGSPPSAKAVAGQIPGQKAVMPSSKPRLPISPRSSLSTTTPPPSQSSQQASSGCISPSSPPPTSALFKTPSSAGGGAHMEAESMGDANTPASDSPPAATTAVQEEAGLNVRKAGGKSGNAAAKGSFPCRFCDQAFSVSGASQAHMRFHLGISPHQCNMCDYVAPDKATSIRHSRTHSGERPYVCRMCHYPFTVKANCERHLRKKHNKTSRKDIEKNIKYVTFNSAGGGSSATTAQEAEAGCETTCRFCGEDSKTYRASQIHSRTHNGCQRKPFECRRCGAAFSAKRNCIHHSSKQHPEVQEREIEGHITTSSPPAVTAPTAVPSNGMSPPIQVSQVKAEESIYPAESDQPSDFSAKGRGSQTASPVIKTESASQGFACSDPDQPIDSSIPSKRQRREAGGGGEESKTEHQQQLAAPSADEKTPGAPPPSQPPAPSGCYQLPPAGRAQRLKPSSPKPAAASTSSPPSVKDSAPSASIAQIISSVSAAQGMSDGGPQPAASSSQPDSTAEASGSSAVSDPPSDDVSDGSSRRRSRKKSAASAAKEKVAGAGIDSESSGEFASVEKMLATTDANKFSTYSQTGAAESTKRDPDRTAAPGGGEEKEGRTSEEGKPAAATVAAGAAITVPQTKGKKNAYSNSVQKMTCPFCPRVFPWMSSSQRHMLTHTGQKPFPCPRCDAFFSTKSNCERHSSRKHGVTHRTSRRNGAIVKKEGDDGSHESAESQSETEQQAPETKEPIVTSAPESGPASAVNSPAPSEATQLSPAPKTSQEQQDAETTDQADQQGAPETKGAAGKQPPQSSKAETTDDDDCQSNKSLDSNFGKKLIDFKLSSSSSGSAPQEEQASASCPPQEGPETPEGPDRAAPSRSPTGSPAAKQQQQPDYKHVCRVCAKSFRYATTSARHERAHLSEEAQAATEEAPSLSEEEEEEEEEAMGSQAAEQEGEEKEAEEEEGGESGGESGESERSDEEASEPKSAEGGETAGGRVDKRKKICSECGKRFWSSQDSTRHMRSHTGERPYKCQTCERTFTSKHSSVRHQRIHSRPRGADGDASEDGDSCAPTPTSTCPPSENESEAKESEEEVEGQREESGAAPEEKEKEEEEPESKTAAAAESATPDGPKDPSGCPTGGATSATDGFIHGSSEIHNKPGSERILPNGEPPMVGAD